VPSSPDSLQGPLIDNGFINQESRNVPDPVIHFRARGGTMTQSFLLLPVAGETEPKVTTEQFVAPDSIKVKLDGPFGAAQVTVAASGTAQNRTYSLHLER